MGNPIIQSNPPLQLLENHHRLQTAVIMKNKIIITGGSGFIGTNVVQHYLDKGWEVLSLDRNKPKNPEHAQYFRSIDLLNRTDLIEATKQFSPTYLIHLAARTDLDETNDIKGYAANIQGVQNVIDACDQCSKLKRVIFASSMLVCRFGYIPKDEFDYSPNTLYGESKVLTEKIIRDSDMKHEWTIVRPTTYSEDHSLEHILQKYFQAGYRTTLLESAGEPVPPLFRKYSMNPVETQKRRGLYKNPSQEFVLDAACREHVNKVPHKNRTFRSIVRAILIESPPPSGGNATSS